MTSSMGGRDGFRRVWIGLVLAAPLAAACGGGAGQGNAAPGEAGAAPSAEGAPATALAIPTLNTFDPRYVQIDVCPPGTSGDPMFGCPLDANGNPQWGPDANLYMGSDPADGTLSSFRPNPPTNPVPGGATWIDWADLTDVTNHIATDWQASGKDPTAFPQSNECVGPAQVLSKMDLVDVGFSNNTQFASIAVLRAGNSGDAGYYWIFTKRTPHQDLGSAPCAATQQRLTYDIQAGDVLLVGHYHPSSTLPLLQAFKAVPQTGTCAGVEGTVSNCKNYNAVAAIDYTNAGLWSRDNTAVIAVAVNETITAPTNLAGGFTTDGMKNLVGSAYDTETFAEAAIDSTFFTGGSPCGVTFYASVITRSSGSGGTQPDLKDLAGPYRFNFGNAKVQATVAPSCSQQFGYEITSFKGMNSQEITPTTCTWKLNGPGFATDYVFDSTCSSYQLEKFFTDANLVGTYNLSVTAQDATGCQDTAAVGPVTVYKPLGANASMTGSCALKFDYSGSGTDGSGSYSYAWSFTGPGSYGSSSAVASGTMSGLTASGTYNGSLTVTDLRTDLPAGSCTAPATASAAVFGPVSVVLSVNPSHLACTTPNSNFDTSALFTATASGGAGSYTYVWGGAASACTTSTCKIDETNTCASDTLSVKVVDATCGASNQPTGTYAKVTTVDASVSNP